MGKIMMNGVQYGVGGITDASDVKYDNTQSGMTATNVQGAVDELQSGLMKSALIDKDGTVTTSSGGTANISAIVPYRTVPVLVRATNISAFITVMYNINGTYWIRALDWDGVPIANTSLNLKVSGIKTDAIKDW